MSYFQLYIHKAGKKKKACTANLANSLYFIPCPEATNILVSLERCKPLALALLCQPLNESKERRKEKQGREGGRERQKDGQQTDIIVAYHLRKEAC